jgi:SAM-dependent methyltransferase
MLTIPATSRRASPPPARHRRLAWPFPALLAWALAWLLHLLPGAFGAPAWLGLLAGCVAGVALGLLGATRMRALVIAGGFPLSLLASGAAAAMPAWPWLIALALLLLLYPRTAWRDAPLFPTPAHALDGLAVKAQLPPGARVLDAGCGLGHGLRALRRAYPRVQLEGVEWSGPLALAARLACRHAHVRRADMWAQSWAPYDLVYLFQRPESMPRALAKAAAEMACGSWVASLEFEATGWLPQAVLTCPDGRPLWLYRLPLRALPAGRNRARISSAAVAGR